jgi:hypothetical protein
MKTINKNTLLKCENKIFQPIEVDGVVYWVDKEDKSKGVFYEFMQGVLGFNGYLLTELEWKVIAQSQQLLERIPVISLDSYIERLAEETRDSINKVAYCCSGEDEEDIFDNGFIIGHKSNPNQYTQKDIEKAIELARLSDEHDELTDSYSRLSSEGIVNQINSISIINIDEQFYIISYE